MGFKVNLQGVDITASSMDEAIALARKIAAEQLNQPPKTGRPRLNGAAVSSSPNPDVRRALMMLKLIRDDNSGEGPAMDTLIHAVEGDGPKGLGGRMARINKLIMEAGFSTTDVYTNQKVGDAREWLPGPKIQQAIDKLKAIKG